MNSLVQLVWFLLLLVDLFDKSLTVGQTLQHVGCFDLNYALSMSYHRHIPEANFHKCLTLCSYRNTKYAGIETSDNFCYCGGDIAEASVRRNDTLCNVQCPDESVAVCGGDWLMSVYLVPKLNTSVNTRPQTSTLALNGTTEDLRLLIGASIGVTMINPSILEQSDKIMTTLDWAYSVDYHFSKNLVFAFVKQRILKSTLKPKLSDFSATPYVVKEVGKCEGFAVDWKNDRIYWAFCDPGGVVIQSFDLSGNNLPRVLKRPGVPVRVKNMVVDPYERMLFWTGDGVIESCTLSGDNFKTNMTIPEETTVRSIFLDIKARRLYYASVKDQTFSLNSMDYTGYGHKEHFQLVQLKNVYGLGVFRGYVYWINFASSRDVIYQAPLNLTHFNQIKVIRIVETAVWNMKLVHSELQTHPAINPCDNMGCSHHCIVEPPLSLTAHCFCPPDLQLDNKETTCINSTQERHDDPVQTTNKPGERGSSVNERSADASQARTLFRRDHSSVLLVMLLAGTTVLLVLGLLYFGNLHWSSIQAKLFRVPYMRQEQHREGSVNPQYDTTEDVINLI